VARAYTVGTVALALDIPAKWIDNVLSHHAVPGVAQKRQGVSRRVSLDGVLRLGIANLLMQELGLQTANAISLAGSLTSTDGTYRTPAGVSLHLDLAAIRADFEARLAQAVEIAPVPRRGRPPSSKTGRPD
jgi:hypothetical protein